MEHEGYKFLQTAADDELLRNNALNILESYAFPWDVLAESAQNSVDAIEERANKDLAAVRELHVAVNCAKREIEFSDTGTGISRAHLFQILAPGKSLKRGRNAEARGEKGVGLSFLIFSCDYFRIETCDGAQTTSLEVIDANAWVNGVSTSQPECRNVQESGPSTFRSSPTYTRIFMSRIAKRDDVGMDVFSLSKVRLRHLIRTRTAIGNTAHLFGRNPRVSIDVWLQYTGENGVPESADRIDFSFARPSEYLPANDVVDWARFERLLVERKTKAVANKSLERSGTTHSASGHEIRWYLFASSRKTYDAICETSGLKGTDSADLEGGVFIATKGMPTGVSLTPPRSQQAAYWPSLFIVLEYDNIKWDLGRKHVGGRTTEMLRKVAGVIFDGVVDHLTDFIAGPGGNASSIESQLALDDLKVDAKTRQDLGVEKLSYLKAPTEEQSVIAIFYELIGRDVLKGYATYANFGKDRYDAYMRCPSGNRAKAFDVFVEFKFEVASILKDFEDKKKQRDIRLLVAWSMNEALLTRNGIEIERVDPWDTSKPFHGRTHRLTFPGRFAWGNDAQMDVMLIGDLVGLLRAREKSS